MSISAFIARLAVNGGSQWIEFHDTRKHNAVADRVLDEKGRALIYLERMKLRSRGHRSRCDFGRLARANSLALSNPPALAATPTATSQRPTF